MIGQLLGHYRIEAKLGEGGMGVVYKARDTHLDRPVAIKVLAPGKATDPGRKQRFVQEAKSASALNHPNIVAIYDIGSEAGLDFIAIDQPSGETRLQFFDFGTGKTTTVARNFGPVRRVLTATADGRTILFTRIDSSVNDLMLVENFR